VNVCRKVLGVGRHRKNVANELGKYLTHWVNPFENGKKQKPACTGASVDDETKEGGQKERTRFEQKRE